MTEALIGGIVVFVLSTYLGASLIGRVPPTLHTPLMSGANAVSGITVVGAILVAGAGLGWLSNVLGFLAIVFAMMNVVGGYAVTDRMLEMFKKSEKPKGATGTAGTAGTAGTTAGGREGAK